MEYVAAFENVSHKAVGILLDRERDDAELTSLSGTTKAILTTTLVIFILFTTSGNLLTICVIIRNKRLRTISNMYLASLAAADMVVGSFVMIFMLLYTITCDSTWIFGDALCRVWTFVDYTCCTASLTNVCLIARDRYVTVSQPLKSIRKRTKRGALYNILFAWMIPLIFWATSISLLAISSTGTGHPMRACEVSWRPKFIVIVAAVSMMYVPIVTIVIFFGAMMCFLHRHMNSMNHSFRRTESVKRQQSFASVMSEDATSEKSGGISFNPKFSIEATYPLIDHHSAIRKVSSAVFSHGSSESTETASTDYSAEIPGNHEVGKHVRSVATNTSPERYGLVRSVGTNTSPMLVSNNSRASLTSATSDTKVILQEGSMRRIFRRLRSESKLESDMDSSDTEVFQSRVRRHRNLSQSTKSDINSQVSRFSIDSSGSTRWNRYASVMRAERQNSVEKSRLKQQVSAAKTLGLILGFLLLCWIPFSILCPMKAYWPDIIPTKPYQISIWINYMNSAINPIIYCLCNPQFRHAYRQLLWDRK